MNTGNEELSIIHTQFIGKIIASFTHEVKNHLAFIKEPAGLIGDIILSNELLGTKYITQITSITKSKQLLKLIDNLYFLTENWKPIMVLIKALFFGVGLLL